MFHNSIVLTAIIRKITSVCINQKMLFLKAKQLLISKESSQYSKFFLTLLFSSTFSGQY